MSNLVVTSPQRPYTFPDKFKAVSNGDVYAGLVDKTDLENPANQIQVYVVLEDGYEVPVSQPLKINSGGLLVYNGQPAKFVVKQNYSMLVMQRGKQVFYEPNMAFVDPESSIIESVRIANIADSFIAGGKIFPVSPDESLYLNNQSTTIPSGVSRLRVETSTGVYELLWLWEPSGDFSSSEKVITNIVKNNYAGYTVTAGGVDYEFTTKSIRTKRGQQDEITSIDFDISAIGFGFPINKNSSSVDVGPHLNKSIQYASENNGGTIVAPSSVVSSNNEKITVISGCTLKGAATPQTFDNFKTSLTILTQGNLKEDDGTTLAPIIEIGEGSNNPSVRNRAIHVQGVKVLSQDQGQGLGFSSVNTDYTDFTQSAFNFRMTDNVAENLQIGFRIRNSWNLEVSKNVAIRCDTGHRYDGSLTSGGTSSLFSSNLSYLCRIGHDFQATGWTYTEMVGCGSDGCEIGARFNGASYRGFSLKNFGFENADSSGLTGEGVGVLVDNGTSGILDIDGMLCGIHDDPNVVFVKVVSCQRLNIRNTDIGSSVINSGVILKITQPDNVGRITIEGCDWYGSDFSNIGDVYNKKVTLINTRINNRHFRMATGGLDIYPHMVKYTSGGSGIDGTIRPNKQIYSIQILMDTNAPGTNRFIEGVPAFNTSQIEDGTIIEFVNATDVSNPSSMGLRSEDAGVGDTGIVRDPAINTPTSINLNNPGDRAKFQKRSDGKLYQLTLEEAGV